MRFCYPVYDPVGTAFGVHRQAHWDCDLTTDLDLVSQQPFRVATVPVFFNSETFWPGINLLKINPDLAAVRLDEFDLVLVHDVECCRWPDVEDWLQSVGIVRYLFVANNLTATRNLPSEKFFFKPHWMIKTVDDNLSVPTNQSGDKPYMFEAMMGARRPHRDYIMLAMTCSGQLEHNIVNYRGFPGGSTDVHTEEFQNIFPGTQLNFPYISPKYDPAWEPVSTVLSSNISFPVPSGIYQKTHYSIVPESQYTGDTFFATEKTAKVLLAQRLAVWFAPENFLQNLRSLGFETFGDVIDESYDQDDYHRDWKRFERAWHTVEHMARFEDPVLLYQKLRPRLEHNRNHMLTLEQRTLAAWQQRMQELIPAEHWSV